MNVPGPGGNFSGKGARKAVRYTVGDLDTLLLSACGKSAKGIVVTVEEVQNVPLDDASRICSAFRCASTRANAAHSRITRAWSPNGAYSLAKPDQANRYRWSDGHPGIMTETMEEVTFRTPLACCRQYVYKLAVILVIALLGSSKTCTLEWG